MILLPGYTFWKETEYSLFTPELINFFDRNTIADSVRNPKTVWLVVLMSWVVSILAYSFIYKIANKMSKFEFTPPSRRSILCSTLNYHKRIELRIRSSEMQ